ncbi:interaptin, putative [Entamoeba histolytica HM-1:IMSS-B]|uniref:Interaptin, putative n=4 Tax=Entamoeba histolytica TaxID=5759 RepID=C4LT58_ENTH1|nr:interaptin, putative [Entamoeba histolytica HM-1:IMSS]EAL52198.1 interaptin, putative [Entamoeba histolytica HM-1:IMSS]EMH74103.1 interaptin, putative [Entamoeba histolytica HM-1:IMSS-B]ENY63281.1 interaptin, putative [Entamoeba histolytica HM-1:IMSS-A]GAT91731.1 interaptin putative [Entamoeba histolytica]|eukprot:XP_657575.1 interaptin, putative [Entamoeba histolytica HM-1:IMSS]
MEEITKESIIQKLLEEKSLLIDQLKQTHQELNQSQTHYFMDREKFNVLYNSQQSVIQQLKQNEINNLQKIETLSQEIAKLQVQNAIKETEPPKQMHIQNSVAVDGILKLIPENKRMEASILLDEFNKFNENEHILFVQYLKQELEEEGINVFSKEEREIQLKEIIQKIKEEAINELKRCEEGIIKKNEIIELLKRENEELENALVKQKGNDNDNFKINLPFKQEIIRENEELTEKLANTQIELDSLKKKKIEELKKSSESSDWDEMKKKVEKMYELQQENSQLKLQLSNDALFNNSRTEIKLSEMKRQLNVSEELNEKRKEEITRLQKENEDLENKQQQLIKDSNYYQSVVVSAKQETEHWKSMWQELQGEFKISTIAKVDLENQLESLKSTNNVLEQKIKAFEGKFDPISTNIDLVKEKEDTIEMLTIEKQCLQKRVEYLEKEQTENIAKQNQLVQIIWKNKEKVDCVDETTSSLQKKIGELLFDLKKEEEQRKILEENEKQCKNEIDELKKEVTTKQLELKEIADSKEQEVQSIKNEYETIKLEKEKKEIQIQEIQKNVEELTKIKKEKEENDILLRGIQNKLKELKIEIKSNEEINIGLQALIEAQKGFEEKQLDLKRKESLFKQQIEEQNMNLTKLEGIIGNVIHQQGIDETSKNIILYLQQENNRLHQLISLNDSQNKFIKSNEQEDKLKIEIEYLKEKIQIEQAENDEWKKRMEELYNKKDVVPKSQLVIKEKEIETQKQVIEKMQNENKENEQEISNLKTDINNQLKKYQSEIQEQQQKQKQMEEEINNKTQKWKIEKEKLQEELNETRSQLQKSKDPFKESPDAIDAFKNRLTNRNTQNPIERFAQEQKQPIITTTQFSNIFNETTQKKEEIPSNTDNFSKVEPLTTLKLKQNEQQTQKVDENKNTNDETVNTSDENEHSMEQVDSNESGSEEQSQMENDDIKPIPQLNLNVFDMPNHEDKDNPLLKLQQLSNSQPQPTQETKSNTSLTSLFSIPKTDFSSFLSSDTKPQDSNAFSKFVFNNPPQSQTNNTQESSTIKDSIISNTQQKIDQIGLKSDELFPFGDTLTTKNDSEPSPSPQIDFQIGSCLRVKQFSLPSLVLNKEKAQQIQAQNKEQEQQKRLENLKANTASNKRNGLNLPPSFH